MVGEQPPWKSYECQVGVMSPGPQIVALLLSETSLGLTRTVSFPRMLT
jgi:hypothetical protein